jgi:hypothetical protein
MVTLPQVGDMSPTQSGLKFYRLHVREFNRTVDAAVLLSRLAGIRQGCARCLTGNIDLVHDQSTYMQPIILGLSELE